MHANVTQTYNEYVCAGDDGKQKMENIVDKFTIKTLFFIVIIRASHVTSVDLGNHGHTA